MRVRDIIKAVEELAPPGLAYEWDRCGLSVGDPDSEVAGVLVALTVNDGVLKAAKKAGATLVISHHPLIWEPLAALRSDNPTAALCLRFAQAGISCYSAHTNLDVTPGGVNDAIALRLGFDNSKPLLTVQHAGMVKLVTFVPQTHLAKVREAVCGAGAGVIGEYSHCSFSTPGTGTFMPSINAKPFTGERQRLNEEPECRFETNVPKARLGAVLNALHDAHPYEQVAYDLIPLDNRDPAVGLGVKCRLGKPSTLDEFAENVRAALEVTHVRVCGGPRQKVSRVAILGGSGGGQASRIPCDIDVLVTGDVSYHDALTAMERGLAIIDAGHAGTEKWMVPALAAHIKKTCTGVHVSTHIEQEVFRILTK